MMDKNAAVALHVWVSGRVQGVFFRDSTRRRAVSLGLGGWVQNLPDGRVEALFVGGRGACEQALEFVERGPEGAHVTGVESSWEEAPLELPALFEIRF